MEVVFNDLSLDNQFISLDEFEEYFQKTLCSLFDVLTKKQIVLYRFASIYTRQVVNGNTLADYLRTSRGRVAATKLRSYIVQLLGNPYLDDQTVTREEVLYDYPGGAQEPNCFTEAIERACPILSFQKSTYTAKQYHCAKDEQEVIVDNILEKNDILFRLLKSDSSEIRFVWSELNLDKDVELVSLNGRCYAEEALLENNLSKDDLLLLTNHLPDLINNKSNGVKTRYWDVITNSGGTTFFEYRMSVSDGREFRLFFLWGADVQFLNGFIKKTQQTPAREIDLAKSIINRM